MICEVCQINGPDKMSFEARLWDWFTGYLPYTVHFCPVHKHSPERTAMWGLSQQRTIGAGTQQAGEAPPHEGES